MLYFIQASEKTCIQRDLCDEWYYPTQTVHSALKTLETQGLISLEFIAENRKSKRIYLTAKGLSLARGVIAPLVEAEQNSFDK